MMDVTKRFNETVREVLNEAPDIPKHFVEISIATRNWSKYFSNEEIREVVKDYIMTFLNLYTEEVNDLIQVEGMTYYPGDLLFVLKEKGFAHIVNNLGLNHTFLDDVKDLCQIRERQLFAKGVSDETIKNFTIEIVKVAIEDYKSNIKTFLKSKHLLDQPEVKPRDKKDYQTQLDTAKSNIITLRNFLLKRSNIYTDYAGDFIVNNVDNEINKHIYQLNLRRSKKNMSTYYFFNPGEFGGRDLNLNQLKESAVEDLENGCGLPKEIMTIDSSCV